METLEQIMGTTVPHGPIQMAQKLNPISEIPTATKGVPWEYLLLAAAVGGFIVWRVYEYKKDKDLKESLKEDIQVKATTPAPPVISNAPLKNSPILNSAVQSQTEWLRKQTNSPTL